MPSTFYLGPEGTFSHILARKRFGKRAALCACPTIEGIFDETLSAPGSRGLVPVENSSGGTVYDSVDSLIRHAGRISIQEELALDVRIALLGHGGKKIRTIFSHFIQLKHHADWLKTRHPGVRLQAESSTAIAARKAASVAHAAALASPGAAEVYGLKVLEFPEGPQTINVTHFYVIGSQPARETGRGEKRTALVAILPNVCGSLHRFLGPFARQKVSLSRIISRPIPGQPQTYVFFLEIEGGPQEPHVAKALKRADALAESLVALGTYPVRGRYKS